MACRGVCIFSFLFLVCPSLQFQSPQLGLVVGWCSGFASSKCWPSLSICVRAVVVWLWILSSASYHLRIVGCFVWCCLCVSLRLYYWVGWLGRSCNSWIALGLSEHHVVICNVSYMLKLGWIWSRCSSRHHRTLLVAFLLSGLVLCIVALVFWVLLLTVLSRKSFASLGRRSVGVDCRWTRSVRWIRVLLFLLFV